MATGGWPDAIFRHQFLWVGIIRRHAGAWASLHISLRINASQPPTHNTSRLPGPPRPPPRRSPAGAFVADAGVADPACGARSVQIKTIWLCLVSSEQVLQPCLVCTVCDTAKLVGLLSLMMVSVPSRCELNASIVAGLNPPPSVPLPRGSVASTLPSSAFTTTQTLGLAHMANRM